MKYFLVAHQKGKELARLQNRVNTFRKQLMSFCDSIEQDTSVEYTGWYVLLKRDGDKWVCLGTFNPDVSDPETELEWDVCLPIPTLESVKEFMGW